MKVLSRTLFVKPEALKCIEEDVNSLPYYIFYSSPIEGGESVDVKIQIQETFVIREEDLDNIMDSFIDSLDENEVRRKKELMKSLLRAR